MDEAEDEEENEEAEVEEDHEEAEEDEEDEEEHEEEDSDELYLSDSAEGDTRIWDPPDEYVETQPGMPLEPGVVPPYQRGYAHLPDIDVWISSGGVRVLTPYGDK